MGDFDATPDRMWPAAGQPARTPICAECREHGDTVSITFVPTSGFGQRGEWRHSVTPPKPGHMPRPHLFIDPPPPRRQPTETTTGGVPDGFLGC